VTCQNGLLNRPHHSIITSSLKRPNCGTNWADLRSSIQTRYNSTGFFRVFGHDPKGFNSSLSDAFIEPITHTNTTILQFNDLHYYNNGGKEDKEGVNLIGTIAERVKPDLVVLTGDIIDGRYCGSYTCFQACCLTPH